MPDDDIVTRGDLNQHCEYLHKPINDNFNDVKGWLEKLDKRQDAAKMLMIGILLTALVGAIANIIVTTTMRTENVQGINSSINYLRDSTGAGCNSAGLDGLDSRDKGEIRLPANRYMHGADAGQGKFCVGKKEPTGSVVSDIVSFGARD